MIMFLKKDKRPNGRLYLSIVEGYRDPITKKNKQKKVKSVGFLDELEIHKIYLTNFLYQLYVLLHKRHTAFFFH